MLPSLSLDDGNLDPLEDSILLSTSEQYDDSATILKKFLFRLLIELHDAGNLSFKTEDYIRKVARAYGIHASVTLAPTSAIVYFQQSHHLSATSVETYSIRIKNGLNFSKLEKLDTLCWMICGKKKLPFEEAVIELQTITNVPALYSPYLTPLLYMLASFSCAIAFYGGRWVDGLIAFLLGYIVYSFGYLSGTVRGICHIEGFLATSSVSFIAFSISKYILTPLNIPHCVYAQIFGGVVWLLPGVTLSVSLLELYSSMIVYGASRLIYGIAIAAQLGFGLGVGYRAANPQNPLPDTFISGCLSSTHAPVFQWILLILAVLTFSLICNAELKRIPGLLLTSIVGFALSTYTITGAGSLIIASFCVTISARLYSYYIRRRYLLYVYGGLLVLVPGSVSVRGFIGIWAGDSASAVEFTFLMLTNCICLALGVFLGLIPRKRWMLWRRQKMMECLSRSGQFCFSCWGCFCRWKDRAKYFLSSHTHVFLKESHDEEVSHPSNKQISSPLDSIEITAIDSNQRKEDSKSSKQEHPGDDGGDEVRDSDLESGTQQNRKDSELLIGG